MNHEGRNHVFDEPFRTDRDARDAATEVPKREGAIASMRGDNVFPFHQG
jgi:hypothetical protein